MVAGMATPAMSAITAGARTNVPTCQITIFFRLHTCFPQKVPEKKLKRLGLGHVDVVLDHVAVVPEVNSEKGFL